ncbi:MAG: cobalt-precorrin-5B (C(1))-methyltransferase CbiD [Lachnospiraceae bacterium]|nr:cobalt-precorrin-5B (C(1))-methyltransferase CbiD [Lachnospiraceae bacterium]
MAVKKLREGVSTGSCMTGAATASAIWQTTGECPAVVRVDAPIGKTLYLDIIPHEYGVCGVIKDAGDDPDVTDKSEIIAKVDLFDEDGEISFVGGEGVGTITQEGCKLPVGESAINPVPRKMCREALRKVIGNRKAVVTASIPNGKKLANRTFNPRLGIVGGISILGTTGIVRPMSEQALKDSLMAELDMYQNQGKKDILFVLGATGEQAMKDLFGQFECTFQVSNYVGYFLEAAADRDFKYVLIGGGLGKLVKLANGTTNTHSHVSGGRIETICTHAALHGASREVILELYECRTTKAAVEIIDREGLNDIWADIAEKASDWCQRTAHQEVHVGIVLLDPNNQVIAMSKNARDVLNHVVVSRQDKNTEA